MGWFYRFLDQVNWKMEQKQTDMQVYLGKSDCLIVAVIFQAI